VLLRLRCRASAECIPGLCDRFALFGARLVDPSRGGVPFCPEPGRVPRQLRQIRARRLLSHQRGAAARGHRSVAGTAGDDPLRPDRRERQPGCGTVPGRYVEGRVWHPAARALLPGAAGSRIPAEIEHDRDRDSQGPLRQRPPRHAAALSRRFDRSPGVRAGFPPPETAARGAGAGADLEPEGLFDGGTDAPAAGVPEELHSAV